jgi:hypothetical protein
MLAGGEFVIRCLGMSRYMVPIASANDVYAMIQQSWADDHQIDSYQTRLNMIVAYAPDSTLALGGYWHDKFLNSTNWLDTDRLYLAETNGRPLHGLPSWFSTPLWIDAHHASKAYFDRFWRDPSCAVSHADLGLVIKTHQPSEIVGLLHLIPHAKVFSLENYDQWQNWCINNKIPFSDRSMWQSPFYKPVDRSFKFDVDAMIWSDDNFLSQMSAAYSYFDLDDFDMVKDHLVQLKNSYLMWNTVFSNSSQLPNG